MEDIIVDELVSGKFSRIAALTVFAIHKPRIFEQGKSADQSQIGEYVEGPYKDKRQEKGREIDFVNLEMTGQMKRDYQPTAKGDKIVGYRFSNQFNADKSYWNEERYNKDIFFLSEAEEQLFIDTLGQLMFP